MIEFPDIGDLRPAPRRTPTAVLWLMLLVVVGGASVLIWLPHDDAPGSKAAVAPNRVDGDRRRGDAGEYAALGSARASAGSLA